MLYRFCILDENLRPRDYARETWEGARKFILPLTGNLKQHLVILTGNQYNGCQNLHFGHPDGS